MYPESNNWIAKDLMAGVSRETIARKILERLEECDPRGDTDAIDEFLDDLSTYRRLSTKHSVVLTRIREHPYFANGPSFLPTREEGSWVQIAKAITIRRDEAVPTDPAWESCFAGLSTFGVLIASEREEALRICAEKAPQQVYRMRQVIEYRIRKPFAGELMFDVIDILASRKAIRPQALSQMSPEDRRRIAARIDPVERDRYKAISWAAKFLLCLITDLPEEEREAFWTNHVCLVLAKAASTTVYSSWRRMRLHEPKVEAALRRWLEEDGFFVDVVDGEEVMLSHEDNDFSFPVFKRDRRQT